MKKLILFVTAVALGLGTVACSSDDNSSSKTKDSLQGQWLEVRTFSLDKDKNIIEEEKAHNDGCGVDEMEFKGDVVIQTSFYKDYLTKECKSEVDRDEYKLSGKTISVEYREEGEVFTAKSEIVELTSAKLILESKEDFEDSTSPVVYYRTEYIKK